MEEAVDRALSMCMTYAKEREVERMKIERGIQIDFAVEGQSYLLNKLKQRSSIKQQQQQQQQLPLDQPLGAKIPPINRSLPSIAPNPTATQSKNSDFLGSSSSLLD